MFPKKLHQKLNERQENNALRALGTPSRLIDFSSNDYLGFSKSETIFKQAHQYLLDRSIIKNGATGSRLLSGNHALYDDVETMLCQFHKSEAALIFNSGYNANLGFFSCVPQRGDLIFYDEYCHASIRDGIQMSNAKAYKFKHNDLEDLRCHFERVTLSAVEVQSRPSQQEIYVVTESVFSMDGDTTDLKSLTQFCDNHKLNLIIDEAHAVGVFGSNGCGKIQDLGLEHNVFARIMTFGKALGCHGAAILGSPELKSYLVNFSRPFIYTTGLTPHCLATIFAVYKELAISSLSTSFKTGHVEKSPINSLSENILFFKSEIQRLQLNKQFISSDSAIHCCIISGNNNVKSVARDLQNNEFDVKPILSPTVPKGEERLRFCLHSYNSKEEISTVLTLLKPFI